MGIHVLLWLFHVAVWQKPTQIIKNKIQKRKKIPHKRKLEANITDDIELDTEQQLVQNWERNISRLYIVPLLIYLTRRVH